MRLTTGTPGAGFHPLGEALARAYPSALPDLDLQIRESAGSVQNVEAIERGEADLGFSHADVAYVASVGQRDSASQPFGHLRGLAVLELAPLHLVVRAGAGISGVAGLRGRRVGVGVPGSGTALTAALVLKTFGVEEGSIEAERIRNKEAVPRLLDGTLDAMFVSGRDPVDAVTDATRAGARLLPLSGAAIDRLRHDYPFFRMTVTPAGSYPGHRQPTPTIGVDNLLVCRSDLSESLAYDLTRGFFEVLPSIAALRLLDLEQAPATPIPLHEGAARYYRERELSR